MREIPVDTSRVKFLGTGKAAARAKYAELSDGSRKRVPESHDTDDQGRPLWTVDVIVDDPDSDRAEIAGVKVASFEVPETQMMVEVRFIRLVAKPYERGGRVQLSWAAEGIEGIERPAMSKPTAA